jgi:hypothetical protein
MMLIITKEYKQGLAWLSNVTLQDLTPFSLLVGEDYS